MSIQRGCVLVVVLGCLVTSALSERVNSKRVSALITTQDRTGVVNPEAICEQANFVTSSHCDVFDQVLVLVPSAKNVPSRMMGSRNLHCTARVYDETNVQIGEKLRTPDWEGEDPKWDFGMVVPIACSKGGIYRSDKEHVLEINIRDAPSFPRVWNQQMGRARMTLESIREGEGSHCVEPEGADEDDCRFSINWKAKWCSDHECVSDFLSRMTKRWNERNVTSHATHSGVDCGEGCHNEIQKKSLVQVKKALKYLQQAEDYARQEDFADDRGDEADDRGDHAEDVGNHEGEAHWDHVEDFWDGVEDRAEANKEQAWDNMRHLLSKMPNLLTQACGDSMPSVPAPSVVKDFKKGHVHKIKSYLHSLETDLDQGAQCLRRKWFNTITSQGSANKPHVGWALAGSGWYALKAGEECPGEK